MKTDLVKLVDAFAGLKVVVIGEAMLDCYLNGVANRLCPEGPVPVVTVTNRQEAPGGAANTAVNVTNLGAQVTFLSVVGNDWEGSLLQQVLEKRGVSRKYVLTQSNRRTLTKQRVTAASQLLVRFDQGNTDAIDSEVEQALIEQLKLCFSDCDAVIVSDYGYGILTQKIIEAIAKLQHSQPRILVVDSKHLSTYRSVGATAVKPNYNQAVQLLNIQKTDGEARAEQMAMHAEQLLSLTGAQIAAVTLDAEGAIVFERDSPSHRTHTQRANHAHTSGAGDTFLSVLALALAAGATTPTAADLAATAASVVVRQDGTTACSAQELREMLLTPFLQVADKYAPDPNKFVAYLASRHKGERIVFTNGCFDILHAGHVSYLNRAKALGDRLIIGVNSDASVSRLKGPSRPINRLEDRIQVLSALESVDYLVAFDDDTPINLIRMICPDVYVKGGDYTRETLPEASVVEQLGGIVQILPFVENRSTTSIIRRISSQENQVW